MKTYKHFGGWKSVVGIATCYRLDGSRIEFQGQGFSAPVQTSPRAHTAGVGSLSREQIVQVVAFSHTPI